MRAFFILLISFILLLFAPLAFPRHSMASHTIFFEDFEDVGKNSYWINQYYAGCSYHWPWKFESGKYKIYINEKSCSSHAIPGYDLIPVDHSYVFEVDITFSQKINADRNLIYKYLSTNQGTFNIDNRHALHFIDDKIYMEFVVNGQKQVPNHDKVFNYPFQANQEYRFHIEVTPDYDRIKIKKIGDEHYTFDEIIYHNLTFSNNTFALRAATGSIGFSETFFDNVRVTLIHDDEPTPTPTLLDVVDFKQYDSQWGHDIYNNAPNWAGADTYNQCSGPQADCISRWGCAITSAAMVFDYYGHNVNPGTLNAWLRSVPDGYNRAGGVIWAALSRYSKIMSGPTLEFAYVNYSDNNLKTEIESDRPAIIKLKNEAFGGNHFIVGKGLTENQNDFAISDPASVANPLLSNANQYWGQSLSIGQFRKTNTDLSYIVAFLDNDFQMTMNKSGTPVDDIYYHTEDPYLNPSTQDVDDGETLNSLWYPKPENDNYVFEVSAKEIGMYQLDLYFYDKDGEPKLFTIYGYYLMGDDPHSYSFEFDSENMDRLDHEQDSYSVVDKLEDYHSAGLITNAGVMQSIQSLIRNALRLKSQEYNFAANVLLDVALDRINFFTPEVIDPELAEYLIIVINDIKNS